MRLFKKAVDLHNYLEAQRKKGSTIGFAPTMGALHEGHLSLIRAGKSTSTITVCSIFINPTQFNDPKDFENYPITIEKDIGLLEQASCDILFLPSVAEMYPNGLQLNSHYNLGNLEWLLEGKFRSGHFQGVCAIVNRLLQIVNPDYLFLGQKDYQQCMVLSRLVELMNKKNQIKVVVCPTLREADGLAMSSRNMRLNKEERERAAFIYKALLYIMENMEKEPFEILQAKAAENLTEEGLRVEYISIADAQTLESVAGSWDGKQKLVALIAVFNNEVRLIDNLLLN